MRIIVSASMAAILLAGTIYAQQTSQAAADTKKNSPVLTDGQKAQIREFQLQDSNLEVEILRAQQQQKDNQAKATAFMSTLCRSADGKQYQVHFPDLSCVASTASPGH